MSLFLPPSLPPSLSATHTHKYTHSLSLTHTHTQGLGYYKDMTVAALAAATGEEGVGGAVQEMEACVVRICEKILGGLVSTKEAHEMFSSATKLINAFCENVVADRLLYASSTRALQSLLQVATCQSLVARKYSTHANMHTHRHILTHIHMHTNLHTHIHTHIHTHTHTHTHTDVHTYAHTPHTHTCIRTSTLHVCVCERACMCVCVCVCENLFIYIHIEIYTHTERDIDSDRKTKLVCAPGK